MSGRGLRMRQHPKQSGKPKRSKYGNQKVEIDGHKFDSKAEANVYLQLRELQASGVISDLEVHPRFTFPHGSGVLRHLPVRDPRSRKGFRAGRPISYEADFAWHERQDGKQVRRVVDIKGHDTGGSRLRRGLMLSIHGILVETIPARRAREMVSAGRY